jgi:heparan-alpha-glucosaminide N-acetyltransferase
MRVNELLIIIMSFLQRSITLFLFGIFINTVWGATFETIRIPGVLQRFGIAYFVISFIHVALYRYIANAENTFERVFADLRMIFRQWLVILFITIVYVAIIFTFHVPGCGRAYFGPGGIHDLGTHANCTGGVTGYIDRQFFGIEHMYNHARIRKVYDALVFDPEGLFGCLTTFLQVFLGVQSGMIFLTFPNPSDRIARFLSWGATLLVITFGLTIGTWTQGIIPINKNLWSLSFVTLTSGFAFFLLALIYFIADVRKLGDDFWTIFLYPGMNAIILYLGHSILNRMWPFHFSFDVMNTHFILLLENCYTTVIWILISHFLFRKKMFYSV